MAIIHIRISWPSWPDEKDILAILNRMKDIQIDDTVLEFKADDLNRFASHQLIKIFSNIPAHITSLKISTDIFEDRDDLIRILNAIPPRVTLEVPKESSSYFHYLKLNINKITRDRIWQNDALMYPVGAIGGLIGLIAALFISFSVIMPFFAIPLIVCFLPIVCAIIGMIPVWLIGIHKRNAEPATRRDIFLKILERFKYTDGSLEESRHLQQIFKEQLESDEDLFRLLIRSLVGEKPPGKEKIQIAREMSKLDKQFAIDIIHDLTNSALAYAANKKFSTCKRIMSDLKKIVTGLPEKSQSEVVALAFKRLPVLEVDKKIEDYPAEMRKILLELLSIMDKETMNNILLTPEEKEGLDTDNASREACLGLQARIHDGKTLTEEQKKTLLSYVVDHLPNQKNPARFFEAKRDSSSIETRITSKKNSPPPLS